MQSALIVDAVYIHGPSKFIWVVQMVLVTVPLVQNRGTSFESFCAELNLHTFWGLLRCT